MLEAIERKYRENIHRHRSHKSIHLRTASLSSEHNELIIKGAGFIHAFPVTLRLLSVMSKLYTKEFTSGSSTSIRRVDNAMPACSIATTNTSSSDSVSRYTSSAAELAPPSRTK